MEGYRAIDPKVLDSLDKKHDVVVCFEGSYKQIGESSPKGLGLEDRVFDSKGILVENSPEGLLPNEEAHVEKEFK